MKRIEAIKELEDQLARLSALLEMPLSDEVKGRISAIIRRQQDIISTLEKDE